MDITRYIEYEVSDENVITLEKGDLIKALNAGQSAIKVFYDGKTLEIPITVEKQENNINNDKESEKKDNDQKDIQKLRENILKKMIEVAIRLSIVLVLTFIIMHFVRKIKK
jgi:hypothetical protein